MVGPDAAILGRVRGGTRRRVWSAGAVVALALAAAFLASFLIGRFPVAPGKVVAILAARLLPLAPTWPPEAETVVLAIRLPRILAAMAVGAALSAAGAAFQGVFRNPMVSPDILGVAAGAGFGAALAILLGGSGMVIQAAAFACGMAAVAATWTIGQWQGRGGDTVLVLILAGIIVGTVFSAGISMIKVLADPHNILPAITFWLMGSLAAITMADLGRAMVPMGVGLGVLMALRWRLNILSFGDEEARALGVDVTRLRAATIVAATLMTAAAVAICGIIGLVGLIVPHLARLLVGPNYRVLLPVCAGMGATFLLVVDDVARALSAAELPLGVLTSLIGAPFFLGLLMNARKGWS